MDISIFLILYTRAVLVCLQVVDLVQLHRPLQAGQWMCLVFFPLSSSVWRWLVVVVPAGVRFDVHFCLPGLVISIYLPARK